MILKILRPLVGIILIFTIIFFLDLETITDLLINIKLSWFYLAVLLTFLSCLVGSLRYKKILAERKLMLDFFFLLKIYLEGVALITLLPVGHIGIDAWRTQAIKKNSDFSYLKIINTLFSDRISGFLGLVIVSASSSIIIYFFNINILNVFPEIKIMQIPFFFFFLVTSLLIIVGTIATYFASKLLQTIFSNFTKFKNFLIYINEALNPLIIFKSLPYSLINNLFVMSAFLFCCKSIDLNIPYLLILSISIAIIIPSLLPFAIGGFGPRETGVVIIFSLFGIGLEEAFICSVLFGITITIQGIIGGIIFILPQKKM
tara:strand:+ start:1427 stop:2374 length:948 start_codon:yes stop_codon:yes gene_type:complete